MAIPTGHWENKQAMLKFHLVTWANRADYQRQLESYFRIRYQIYVEERGWRQIDRPIPVEMDAFDNEDAIYLLGLDENGAVGGGSRLVPSLKPHLLSEVFPMLSSEEIPRGEAIYEWTRIFVAPRFRALGASSPAAGAVLCGLLEACLHLRIEQMSVVCETFWLKRLRGLGWPVEQLGPEMEHADGDILALLIQVDREALDSTRKAYGLSKASLLA